MAMEERQTKIREGAGLEESRLNTEFIEMMKKWGPHFMMGLAILAGLWVLYTKYEEYTARKADTAWADLDAAEVAGNPEALVQLASEHADSRGVALRAKSDAADLHLNAARTGVPIGAQPDEKDREKLANGAQFLTDDQKKEQYAKAEALYSQVAADANDTMGQTLMAIGALNGLASIAEDRGDLDKARGYYQQAAQKAAAAKLPELEKIAKARIDSLDKLKEAPKLLANAQLPGYEKPVITPVGGFTATGPNGEKIPINVMPTAPGATTTPAVTIPGGTSLTPSGQTPTPAPSTPAPAPSTSPSTTPPAPSGATPSTPASPAPAPAPEAPKPGTP